MTKFRAIMKSDINMLYGKLVLEEQFRKGREDFRPSGQRPSFTEKLELNRQERVTYLFTQ